ncbi:MAG TPA: TetR family transcriptional regulator [Solimonas sp.]|nr:TetR family transcriptional regulator [Solimonas sp.]
MDSLQTPPAVAPVSGKQRLIEAALRLAAREGAALSSLGLRELAREAGLNHNTFYRHFGDLDELGQAAAASVATQLMAALKEIRRNAARHADATIGSTEYFLDFVRDNRELVTVGLRELHSTDSPMRRALQQVLKDIALESVEQITTMNLVPGIGRDSLFQATSAITYYMLYRGLDYLEQPRQRRVIRDEIVDFIRAQFMGRIALQAAIRKP